MKLLIISLFVIVSTISTFAVANSSNVRTCNSYGETTLQDNRSSFGDRGWSLHRRDNCWGGDIATVTKVKRNRFVTGMYVGNQRVTCIALANEYTWRCSESR